jgi:hypothetical protein
MGGPLVISMLDAIARVQIKPVVLARSLYMMRYIDAAGNLGRRFVAVAEVGEGRIGREGIWKARNWKIAPRLLTSLGGSQCPSEV